MANGQVKSSLTLAHVESLVDLVLESTVASPIYSTRDAPIVTSHDVTGSRALCHGLLGLVMMM